MMKKYKWSLLLGSLLSLSPILIGLLLWNQLPAKLPTHFSTGNTPDGLEQQGNYRFRTSAFYVCNDVVLLSFHPC